MALYDRLVGVGAAPYVVAPFLFRHGESCRRRQAAKGLRSVQVIRKKRGGGIERYTIGG